MPMVFDAICDDMHVMHVMNAMDNALNLQPMSLHEKVAHHEAPCLSGHFSIANMPIVGTSRAPPLLNKRGRPPKRTIVGKGRPKALDANLDANNDIHVSDVVCGNNRVYDNAYKHHKVRGKNQKQAVKKGRPSSMQQVDGSGDEHASVREEDELLEAEGPVLRDSDDERDSSNTCMPTWKSGDKMHDEPEGTFKQMPMFVDIAGPDMGQIPREFIEIQLFFSLFSLDLVDAIMQETNRYTMEKRDKVLIEHESTQK
ncbi:hypothetical protein L7F22_065461 [Adiantum nelumboides]|nr:hypothetical protein [Adiantum nelumboides]